MSVFVQKSLAKTMNLNLDGIHFSSQLYNNPKIDLHFFCISHINIKLFLYLEEKINNHKKEPLSATPQTEVYNIILFFIYSTLYKSLSSAAIETTGLTPAYDTCFVIGNSLLKFISSLSKTFSMHFASATLSFVDFPK